MSRTRRIGFAGLIMLGTIIKHLLSSEYTPLDRLIEFGVFVFIAYEVFVGIRDRRKAKKRRALVEARSEAIRRALAEGHELRSNAPRLGAGAMKAGEWINLVNEWE